MKRKLQFIMSSSALSILACTTLAQDPPPRVDSPDYTRERISASRRADRLNGAAKASDLIGMTVKNYQNEKLGKVDELAVDVESGRVIQVILSTGGLAGIGDTLTAVPPGALHHDVAQKVLHLDADKEKLKNAPKFENAKWAEYSDSAHLTEVYRYYGEERSYTFVQPGVTTRDGKRITDDAPNTTSTRNADGTWNKERITSDSQSMIPPARLSHIQKASKLMGTAVKNLQDEKLGDVNNMLVDLPAGRLVAVVVSTGGFLGMGDELSAVPPTALRFSPDQKVLQLDTTKEALSAAPHFKSNQWPDFNQPSYAGGVYRAYKVEPYFTTDADNTRRNVRDRDNQTLTPLNQGSSEADLATTTQIRKEIIAAKNLSINGNNVKIITRDGRVTLRGPVTTAEEKRLIGEIAERIATGDVDNQLEVTSDAKNNN